MVGDTSNVATDLNRVSAPVTGTLSSPPEEKLTSPTPNVAAVVPERLVLATEPALPPVTGKKATWKFACLAPVRDPRSGFAGENPLVKFWRKTGQRFNCPPCTKSEVTN
jgi:hypothetical protein